MQKCEIHFFGPQKMRYTKRIKVQSYSSMIRSYHREYISSRLITEIKHDWAATVVPTEMGCEVAVTNLLLVKQCFPLLFSARVPSPAITDQDSTISV